MGCEKLKKCVALHFFILNICRNKNFIYLCTRKRKQCNNAEVAQLVEHNLAKVRVAGSSPVFRSSLKRKGCSNGGIGRHEGLKILWPLRLCGFKSRFEYTSLSKQYFAEVAQLVEHNLAKVRVAGSSPVFRSLPKGLVILRNSGAFYFMYQLVTTTVTHKEEAILKLPNKRIRINHHFIIKHEKDICTTLTVLSDL